MKENLLLLKELFEMLEYRNEKIFLQKATFQIGLRKIFWLEKLKNTVTWKS